MSTLLLKNATLLVTMDNTRQRISDGGLFIQDNVIEAVGPTSELPTEADHIVNADGMLILPGLVNTHHHLYQTLTRAVPAAEWRIPHRKIKQASLEPSFLGKRRSSPVLVITFEADGQLDRLGAYVRDGQAWVEAISKLVG